MIRLTLLLTASIFGVLMAHEPNASSGEDGVIAVTPLPAAEGAASAVYVPADVAKVTTDRVAAVVKSSKDDGLLVVAAIDAPSDAIRFVAPDVTRATLSPVSLAVALTGEGDHRMLVVTGTRVNLRAGPSTRTEVIGKLVRGQAAVLISDAGDGWSQIRHPETGAVGFMSSDFLRPVEHANG